MTPGCEEHATRRPSEEEREVESAGMVVRIPVFRSLNVVFRITSQGEAVSC